MAGAVKEKLLEAQKRTGQCEGKIRYLDQTSAEARAARDRARYRDAKFCDAYQCSFCKFWHVGTKHKKKYARKGFVRGAKTD